MQAPSWIEFDVDLFDLFNSSAPTATGASTAALTFASGPTFGYATDVLPARIVRLGLRFTF